LPCDRVVVEHSVLAQVIGVVLSGVLELRSNRPKSVRPEGPLMPPLAPPGRGPSRR
jgi:hypothetical protein